ncbi:MAG: glycosyltransferase family 4 protein [Deltaproteobacteria bacterium]|nr:glycosyltransferase family 4 protein [Candidatus Anaeroferrophillus wilburensis]MBN2890069.1 glycosyltransferase family 4 protein [Deltaproteobacteria bacterium]
MIKVLHCLSQIPGQTGSGVYLQSLIREGHRRGLEQWVICGLPAETPQAEIEHLTQQHIFPVLFDSQQLPFPVAGMSDVMPYPSTLFSSFCCDKLTRYEAAFARVVQEVVRRLSPDIIHSHHLWLMTALIRRLFPNIPLVTTSHGTDLRQLQLADHLALRVISGCQEVDKVMALNEEQKKNIIELYGVDNDQVVVTGTGFRDDLFSTDFCTKGSDITLLYAGKLSRAKGVPWLLEAVAELDITLKIAGGGGGKEAEEIRRQAQKLRPNVTLLGVLSQEELAEECKKAHIFVLPSFYEGLPLVLLEALACSCRLVVTDLPGIRTMFPEETLDDGLVTLVPMPELMGPDTPNPDHLPRFCNNLKQAIKDQVEKVKKQQTFCCLPLEKTLQNNTWQHIFSRVLSIYQEVLMKNGTGSRVQAKQ